MPEDYMSNDQPFDYDDYANQLLEQGLLASPSLLHGGICGVLVGGGEPEADHCLATFSQALEIDIRGELAESCLQLISVSAQALADQDFEFHLFLPDDETEIELRVQALADWCQGFMAAFALALTGPEGTSLGEEVAEILKDIAAIAEVGFNDEADEEEAESGYFEITEYLRFAVLNLFLDNVARLDPES